MTDHSDEIETERRARVQGSPSNDYVAGTVAWWEHEAAWTPYAQRYGTRQSAERIHQRGGFSFGELVDLLGHEPTSWVPLSGRSDP